MKSKPEFMQLCLGCVNMRGINDKEMKTKYLAYAVHVLRSYET